MGLEIEVSTAEEMCDLMCNNRIPTPKKKQCWIFTFGCGQKYEGKAVKIFGNYHLARGKMIEKYGDKWAFQYSEEEWEEYANDPDRDWKMEEIMEVIE